LIFLLFNSNFPFEFLPNLTSLYNDVRDRGNIKNIINIQNFLNLPNKDINIIKKEKKDTLIIIIIYYTDITISAEENNIEKNINIPILFSPTYDQTL
jgi:hypothetical protein